MLLARLQRISRMLVATLSVATTGCSTLMGYGTCAEVPAARLALAPPTLSATGLFADMAGDALALGVMPYRPRFELWSDGATKRRWIHLPAGSKIDAADMDAWRFPNGTKLWKEFTRDGVRVETRYMEKSGEQDDGWLAVAYVWNAEGTEAELAPEGRADVRGTGHDAPNARQCMGCHGGTPGRVLGFSAMQLPRATLVKLAHDEQLSHPAPDNTIPGADTEIAALGYLHANCAHCHNAHRPSRAVSRCFDPETTFDLSLRTTDLARLETTAVYRTAREAIIAPGSPDDSPLYRRAAASGLEPRMPALGTEGVDDIGVALLRRWILAMK